MSRRRAARELCASRSTGRVMDPGAAVPLPVGQRATAPPTIVSALAAADRGTVRGSRLRLDCGAKLLLPPRLCARRCDGSLVDSWNPSPLLASRRTTTGVPLVIDATQCCGYAVARRGGRPSPTMLRG